jgi:DNA ligase (NAD+)
VGSFERKLRVIEYFASRKALDIDGLGPKIVELLMKEGLVMVPSDLFSLKAKDLIGLPGFAEKAADNLIAAIRMRREVPLERFVTALGIPNIGEETARDLARAFRTWEALSQATVPDLTRIPGVGEVVAGAFFSGIRTAEMRREIGRLLRYVSITPVPKAETRSSSPFFGKTVVVTGTLSGMTREEAKRRIREAGGRASGSVSKETDFLVVGADAGSKLARAQMLGVAVLDERAFLELLAKC